MVIFILYIFFISVTLWQLAIWIFLFSKPVFYRNEPKTVQNHEVSVIMCAHNEYNNLKTSLPHILSQKYHSHEVRLVNDNSSDKTEDLATKYINIHNIFAFVNVTHSDYGKGKKNALTHGILSSKYDVLLMTDADCYPNSENWIDKMQSKINNQTQIVLGYSPYKKLDGWLNKFIRFETFYTAIQYFSFALIGQAYMGVGRNLAYRKNLFNKVDGFESHKNVMSGDDDLFINQVATRDNVDICLDKESFVQSIPKNTWSSYFRQKRRHMTTAKYYKWKHQMLLGSISLSHLMHYVLGIILILIGFKPGFIILFMGVRAVVVFTMSALMMKRLEEQDLIIWWPLLEISFLIYYIVLAPALFIKNFNWK